MSKQRIIKRLSWYYPTELFNAFMFSAILIWLIIQFPFADILFLIYGLALMIIILFQGQYYWKIKLYNLKGMVINQNFILNFFSFSKQLNLVFISFIPFVFFLQLFLGEWKISSNNFMGWAIFTNIFGILEYINYYHWQLMYDNSFDLQYLKTNKKLKTASLKKDLDAKFSKD